MKKFLFTILFITFFLLLLNFLNPVVPVAQAEERLMNPLGSLSGPTGVIVVIGRIAGFFTGLIGAVLLLMFVYGGFIWLTSGGTSDKIQKGKKILIWAVIGFVVVLTAYVTTAYTIEVLTGRKITTPSGPPPSTQPSPPAPPVTSPSPSPSQPPAPSPSPSPSPEPPPPPSPSPSPSAPPTQPTFETCQSLCPGKCANTGKTLIKKPNGDYYLTGAECAAAAPDTAIVIGWDVACPPGTTYICCCKK